MICPDCAVRLVQDRAAHAEFYCHRYYHCPKCMRRFKTKEILLGKPPASYAPRGRNGSMSFWLSVKHLHALDALAEANHQGNRSKALGAILSKALGVKSPVAHHFRDTQTARGKGGVSLPPLPKGVTLDDS